MKTSLTGFFEDPFQIDVFERLDDGKLCVCRGSSGAVPRDHDVWEFVLQQYDSARLWKQKQGKSRSANASEPELTVYQKRKIIDGRTS